VISWVFHNLFNGDYGGFENTSGIGDIHMSYLFVPVITKNVLGFERLSTFLEATAPTGEDRLGRGAGVWLYRPGVIATFRATPEISIYPQVSYQFSGNSANSRGGIQGLPDPEDPEQDGTVKTLSVELPFIAVMDYWDGWFGLQAQFLRSFSEKTNFVFLRSDFGKMIGNKTSACLSIQKFIAGQPRLNVIVQARFQFFLNQ
jgi:hypothetical protein